jgi:hypothetical protein
LSSNQNAMSNKPFYNAFISMVLLIVIGCSKNEPPITPEIIKPVVTPGKENPPPPPLSTARLIPIKIESPLETITIKYLGNTASITSIVFDKTLRKVYFSYKDGEVFSPAMANNSRGEEYYIDYFKDAKQNTYKVSTYIYLKTHFTPIGRYLLTYNSLNQIEEVKYYAGAESLLSTHNFHYDLATNRNSIIINNEEDKKESFTFDQKNGIFKHVENVMLLSFEIPHHLFNSIANNVNSRSGSPPAQDYHYTYEYNTDGYPSQVTLNEANVKTVFKITYKAF